MNLSDRVNIILEEQVLVSLRRTLPLINALFLVSPAYGALESEVHESIQPVLRDTDKQIVLEGIKLARFNIRYRQETNRRYRGRSFFYPSIQEAGTALSFANTLLDLSQRAENIHHPELRNRPLLKRGTECGLIGQATKATSFVGEFLYNVVAAERAKQEGYSPKRATAFVRSSIAAIDKLLQQREALVAKADPETQKYLILEGRIMRHLRNQLVYEFKLYSASSREREWQSNTYYIMAAGQNFALMASSIAGIQGFQIPRNVPKAAITNIVASSIGVTAPIVRTLAGISVREYWKRRLATLLPVERETPRTLEQLEADWKDLNEYMTHAPDSSAGPAVLGLDAMIRRTKRADDNRDFEERRIANLRRIAQEQAIAGPPIEMATLARQICQEVAYNYRDNPHLNNRINLDGRISQACGQSYSLIATPASACRAAWLQHRLRQKGELPSQVLEERLKRLDNLEKRLLASSVLRVN